MNINEMPQAWLRNQIGTVPQEPVLFSMSIKGKETFFVRKYYLIIRNWLYLFKENIAYGCPNPESITNEQIYEAAEEANAFSFIDQFHKNFRCRYNTSNLHSSFGSR